MTKEEKLQEAKRLYKTANADQRYVLESLFPELKESKDERIRKALVRFHKSTIDIDGIKGEEILAWLKKQGERKLVDKVEPKFHKGEWYVDKQDGTILQITKVLENTYKYITNTSKEYCCTHYSLEQDTRPWAIQDAKDGDVLLSKHNQPFIYNGIFDEECVGAYCGINSLGSDLLESTLPCNWSSKEGVKPATKEQRDLLFAKMRKAGYEWDETKKKLKKIEEEYNDEDYGIDGLWHAKNILEKTLGEVDGYRTDDGILEHKYAISAVKKLYEQKPTWSKEDERRCQETIDWFERKCFPYAREEENPARESIKWLKTIKQRWRNEL